MVDILEGLNPQQTAAVTAPDGPVLVLAGPGSGKTRVLTHRIAYLVDQRGVPPWHILAVTFTNKASREMRSRVEGLLGGALQGITLGTFHAVCARWLRIEADRYLDGLTSEYVIYDEADQLKLVKDVIVTELNLDDKTNQPARILNAISAAKNDLISPADYQPRSYREEIVLRVYERYQERLRASNAVDFDDLLMRAVELFARHPDVLARYRRTYTHILVDEFQDTNAAQYQLVRLLAGDAGSLFCVGDEDQSIYRWRGADYRNVLRLREDYPALRTYLLEQNYRSTQSILDASRAVIDRNANRTPKVLFTHNGPGESLILYEAHNEQFEADFVVRTIAMLVRQGITEPGGCAVMYRTNAQSRVLEDAFVRANLPYRLVGATRFYGRREIKDLLAYLRVIHNPADQVSLLRVINTPPRGIGDRTLQTLTAWATSMGVSLYEALNRLLTDPDSSPLTGRARNALAGFAALLNGWRELRDKVALPVLLRQILDETRYQQYIDDGTEQGTERWENVRELLNLTAEYEELPLATFLEEVTLVSDVDTLIEDVNAPTLLTLHAAKGLEFDVVFLVGLEEGILPHERSRDDPEAMAEERRLMYVGMTRARKLLYLVYSFARTMWGDQMLNTPSRYLSDIPASLVSMAPGQSFAVHRLRAETTWMSGSPRVERAAEDEAIAFKTGQRVYHPKFGEGIVVECKSSGTDQEISIAFREAGMKRLLASYANLTPLDG